jgi:type IV secretion system protein VirD4
LNPGPALLALAATAALGATARPGGAWTSRRGDRARGPGAAPAGRWNPARGPTRFGAPFGPVPARRVGGAGWARPRDLGALVVRGAGAGAAALAGRLVLGTLGGRRRTGSRRTGRHMLLATEARQSVAVIGPTQCGKTSALAVPAILAWQGPVLAASVKADLLGATRSWRERCGTVWCVDPAASTGGATASWSPLVSAGTWAGARRAAADLTEVAQAEVSLSDSAFWYATAAKLLAPLLFAAAQGGTMDDVLRWLDLQEADEVLDVLEALGTPDAADAVRALRATWERDDRQRSAVYTTAETVVAPFAERAAVQDAGGRVDAASLLGGSNTLYLCAPAHDQRRLRGLFCSLVKHVVDEAFRTSTRSGRPLDPPLLVVLDEAANIAPLVELDGLAATCAGHGIQLVTIWQDLAQMTARYGPRAATVVNNHRAKLFCSGIGDPATLELASQLVGDEELLVPSVTRDAAGGRSTTASPVRRRLLAPDALRRLPPGSGVLVYGALAPARVRLRPWWDDPVLAARGTRPPA